MQLVIKIDLNQIKRLGLNIKTEHHFDKIFGEHKKVIGVLNHKHFCENFNSRSNFCNCLSVH